MAPELEDGAVAHPSDGPQVVPVGKVDAGAQLAGDEHRAPGLGEKTDHPTVRVRLEVPQDHIGEPRWVEDLGDGPADGVVGLDEAGAG
jgi:hypothetical protein